jgi:hypothetical protein
MLRAMEKTEAIAATGTLFAIFTLSYGVLAAILYTMI